jgi:uncharacterized protein YjbJ (UPF0337 family)
MSTSDKAKNKMDEATGKVKEGMGRAKNDPELEDEGRSDQAKANLRQAGEKVKDAARNRK